MPLERYPILYSFRRCPYAMRARLAIAISGQKIVLREIVLRDKPSHLLTVSPKGTVPVLLLPNDTILEESLDIMHWALGESDPQGWLVSDTILQSVSHCLIAQNDSVFKHHLDRYKYPVRYDKDTDPLLHRDAGAHILATYEQRLTTHSWLVHDSPTLADMAILPFIRQFAFVNKNWFDAQPWPHLQKWLTTFLASPLFECIMQKYSPWHEQDDGALASPLYHHTFNPSDRFGGV